MSTTIYFVRHGQAENDDKLNYGRMPGFSLGPIGKTEAQKAADYLVDKKINRIYTSPLERAFQTADTIGNKIPGVKITHSFELNEGESTYWQGLKNEELFLNDAYTKFINDPNTNIGTENLTQIAKRMKDFTESLVKNHPGENIVCVSHEFPILALKLFLEKKPLQSLKSYHLLTGGIIAFVFDGNGEFVSEEEVTFP